MDDVINSLDTSGHIDHMQKRTTRTVNGECNEYARYKKLCIWEGIT